jgi:apolipoprotein N-acyltransferase
LLDLQQQTGIPLLIGAIGYDNLRLGLDAEGLFDFDFDAMFNSAFVVSGGSIQPQRYDKMFLTPFGETMPYISRFPRVERAMLDFAARGMTFDLSKGTDASPLEVDSPDGPLRVATPICFEATIPYVCRRLVYQSGRREADVLINMTNDGWFGSFDPGRANHLLIARWRAIELGVPVVRAANTGISCVVDASGRVLASLEARQGESVLLAEVPLSGTDRTIYARIGDAPGWMAFAASLVLLLLRLLKRPPAAASSSHPAPEPSHAP